MIILACVSLNTAVPLLTIQFFPEKRALSKSALSERSIFITNCDNWLVPLVPEGYFHNYVISDGVCKYFEPTKESKHGLISLKSMVYI
jgi:hypothetical protein